MGREVAADRVLLLSRLLSAVIIPFLITAFLILFVFPDSNGQHFAWNLQPRMSAMMLGATYMTGVFYFATVLFGRRWSQVRAGFLPVTTFAAIMGIATILHLARFNHSHLAFWLWAFLYAVTPFIVPLVWYLNQRACRGAKVETGLKLPVLSLVVIGLAGVSGVIVAALTLLQPGWLIAIWPWTLTALTARVLGAQFALFGVFAAVVLLEPQWSSIRLLLRWQLVSPLLYLVATVVSRHDFNWVNPLAWLFLANVVGVFVLGIPGLYFYMEWKRRKFEIGQPAVGAVAL